VISAEAQREAAIEKAEGEKQQTVLVATGNKDAALLRAQGTEAEGKARGVAEQAVLMAPVNAQITLAEKIASEPNYQAYLVEIRKVEAGEKIGVANASALAAAEIKVIATAGDANSGINSISEALTAKGGVQLGSMLQGLANTDIGKEILSKVTSTSKPNGKSYGRV